VRVFVGLIWAEMGGSTEGGTEDADEEGDDEGGASEMGIADEED
jgi:hypothetical protein